MSYALKYELFLNEVRDLMLQRFPVMREYQRPIEAEFLISPHPVPIKASTYDAIEASIKAIYKLRSLNTYQELIKSKFPKLFLSQASNHAVLMSYDFHIDKDGNPYLIEVNTNASGAVFCTILNERQNQDGVLNDHVLLDRNLTLMAQLKAAFENEAREAQVQLSNVAIMDEDLQVQKMYFEFEIYKALFVEWWGSNVVLVEPQEVHYQASKRKLFHQDLEIDFIYNRFCDFLLEESRSADLLQNYLEGKTAMSPHPKEYLLLADKDRLNLWNELAAGAWMGLDEKAQADLRAVLVPSFLVNEKNQEEIWDQRKDLFFKPIHSYGGKSAYRGFSISRRVFERILAEPFMAQKFVPAPEILLPSVDTGSFEPWKYDLRFFVYRDQIQGGIARLYQGQVTNFKTRGGGFGTINIVS